MTPTNVTTNPFDTSNLPADTNYVHDAIPGINVSALIGQLAGIDGDVFPGISVDGGVRGTTSGWIGPTEYPSTTSGTTPTSPTVLGQGTVADPYQQWGGATAYNNLINTFGEQKSNLINSALGSADTAGSGYKWSVLDRINNLTNTQKQIDRQRVNNESSRILSGRDIMDMVGRGIRSGGAMLAGRNAANSSAAQAIADAYAKLGGRQMSQVGNQYEKNMGDIGISQAEQDLQLGQAPDRFHDELMGTVNNIVTQAGDALATLDAQMASASLPDRIAIEQEKQSIKAQVLGKLQQYDTQLREGVSGIKPADRTANVATANEQLSAGQANPNMFNYTTQAPSMIQSTGPIASELPIFTYNNKSKTQTA